MRGDERAALERFRQRYSAPSTALYGEIEERVLGGRWGANGYTTKAQADELGRRLQLAPGRTLLDVGTGRGWPGLYLAVSTGCSVIGTDMPVEALVVAARRARREGVSDRAAFAAAAGEDQPFRAGVFDAVVHTDVLCWLRRKLAVLRALRRLLRPGGRIAYITIHVTPGLPAAARRRAHRSGPRAVATRSDQLRLLGSAGFTDLEHVDITDEFLATTRAWLREREAHTEELAAVEGADTLAERVRDGRLQLRATEDGLLRRGIFAGTRPPRSA